MATDPIGPRQATRLTHVQGYVAAGLLWFLSLVLFATGVYGYFEVTRFWEEAVVVEVEVRDMRFVPDRDKRSGRPQRTGSYYVDASYMVANSTGDSIRVVWTFGVTQEGYEAAAETRMIRVGYRPVDPSHPRAETQPRTWPTRVNFGTAALLVGFGFFVWASVSKKKRATAI